MLLHALQRKSAIGSASAHAAQRSGRAAYLLSPLTLSPTGTPNYMAPELLLSKAYSTPVDVFAFAVLLNELFTREAPLHRAPSLHHIPAPSLHHPCTIPAPSLHHPCTVHAPCTVHGQGGGGACAREGERVRDDLDDLDERERAAEECVGGGGGGVGGGEEEGRRQERKGGGEERDVCLHLHLPTYPGTMTAPYCLLTTYYYDYSPPQVPWDGYTPADIKAKVVEGQRPRTERTMPRACDGLLRKAWHQDAKMRPTFEQARPPPTPPPSLRPPTRARTAPSACRAGIYLLLPRYGAAGDRDAAPGGGGAAPRHIGAARWEHRRHGRLRGAQVILRWCRGGTASLSGL